MPTINLSPQLVKDAVCPSDKRKCDLFDSNCKGLMLEIRATGGKTYYLRYQDAKGRTRQLRLALAGDVTLYQARKLVEQKRTLIALGQDPCEVKAQTKSMPTFATFIEEQYLPFINSYKRSWDPDVSMLKNHLLPRFAGLYLNENTPQDIGKMHYARKE